jgi:biopolymer transport protein ExbB/TolQ
MSLITRNPRPVSGVAVAAAVCFGLWYADLRAEQAEPQAKPAEAAQDPSTAEPPSPPAAKKEDAKKEELGNTQQVVSIGRVLLEKTNWLGWMFYAAEGSVSVLALSVVLERFVHLRRRKLVPRRFVRRLRDLIARHEDGVENLRTLCENSESPIANVLMAGVIRAGRPLPEVEKALDDAVLREAGAQRSRNRMLSVIATVAPMVGLLGTVVGMILAFKVTSQAGTGKAEMLAEGIYLALLRTAFGLLIAVPALLFAHWFNTRVERYAREMIDVLEETIPTFAALERTHESNGEPLHATEPISRIKTH